MKKMKKALITLVAAATLATNVVGLAACGQEQTDFTKEVEVVAYDGSEVTVTFYHTMGAALQTVLDKYIPKFNELYPNVTIEHSTQGDYPQLRDNVSTEIASGYSPTMAYCYPDHVALYNRARAVVTLDDYIASTQEVTRADGSKEILGLTAEQQADFIKGYYDEGKAYGDDKMYTLPFSKSTEVLYYNKTVFDANGWEVPETWDEMEALCEAIKTKFPNDYPLGYDSEANWFITMTEQLEEPYTSVDGKHFTFNTEKNRAFVERFRGWYEKRWVTTEEIYGSYTSDLFTQTEAGSVKSYMCIGSSGGASYQCPDMSADLTYPFEVGIAPIPQINPSKPQAIQQGPSVCLFKKNNPQEVAAAWLFTKYLTTNANFQAEFSMTNGYTPVIKSAQNTPVYQAFLGSADGNANLQATVVLQTLDLAEKDAFYVSPAFSGSSAARDAVGVLMQNCFVNSPEKGQSVSDFIKKQFESTVSALEYDYS